MTTFVFVYETSLRNNYGRRSRFSFLAYEHYQSSKTIFGLKINILSQLQPFLSIATSEPLLAIKPMAIEPQWKWPLCPCARNCNGINCNVGKLCIQHRDNIEVPPWNPKGTDMNHIENVWEDTVKLQEGNPLGSIERNNFL